jgi:hypothetical protein
MKLYKFSDGTSHMYAWGTHDEASLYAARTAQIYEQAADEKHGEYAEHLYDLLLYEKTIAEKVAGLLDDNGWRWETDDGMSFWKLMDHHNAKVQYGYSRWNKETEEQEVEVCDKGDYFAGDPVRYEFADGSAIVEAGDAWDIEGKKPFSWAQNERS